jgi:hypothetical protein
VRSGAVRLGWVGFGWGSAWYGLVGLGGVWFGEAGIIYGSLLMWARVGMNIGILALRDRYYWLMQCNDNDAYEAGQYWANRWATLREFQALDDAALWGDDLSMVILPVLDSISFDKRCNLEYWREFAKGVLEVWYSIKAQVESDAN